MREIRTSGSEGGVGLTPHPYPYHGGLRPLLKACGSLDLSRGMRACGSESIIPTTVGVGMIDSG
jgi:hypothetical protein